VTDFVEELERLERTVNGEVGVACVRAILVHLRRGQYDLAQNIRCVDGDKTRQYPELEPVLYRLFGCRLHGVKDCGDEWCERKKPTP